MSRAAQRRPAAPMGQARAERGCLHNVHSPMRAAATTLGECTVRLPTESTREEWKRALALITDLCSSMGADDSGPSGSHLLPALHRGSERVHSTGQR